MKWAIMVNFIGITQWFFALSFYYGFSTISLSPILDLGYCFALMTLKVH